MRRAVSRHRRTASERMPHPDQDGVVPQRPLNPRLRPQHQELQTERQQAGPEPAEPLIPTESRREGWLPGQSHTVCKHSTCLGKGHDRLDRVAAVVDVVRHEGTLPKMSGESSGPGASAIAAATSVNFAATSCRFPLCLAPVGTTNNAQARPLGVASRVAELGGGLWRATVGKTGRRSSSGGRPWNTPFGERALGTL